MAFGNRKRLPLVPLLSRKAAAEAWTLLRTLFGQQRRRFLIAASELDLHPESRAVHLLRHGASSLAHASSRFVVVWLLVHGVLKLFLAVELLRGRSWIFPVAAAILAGFVAFMTYKLSVHYSPWVLALALFDLITVILVLNEWRSHRARRAWQV